MSAMQPDVRHVRSGGAAIARQVVGDGDRSAHVLKGVPGEWRLYVAAA